MKRISFFIIIIVSVIGTACNSSSEKNETSKDGTVSKVKTPEDSLMDGIMDGHNVGMARMGKMESARIQAQKLLDSIGKLPAKAKTALEPYRVKLEDLVKELESAKDEMNIWMDSINLDSAKDNIEQRLKYLRDEKLKVSVIKENILNGLQKADSLFKAKL